MSLYGALYASVAGLRSQSTKIGILSDNISNVNTVGYKQSLGGFETLVTSSGLPSAYSPGGVLAQNRALITKQGLIQGTDTATDIAISGSGFFVVKALATDEAANVQYTRAGSFRQDSAGNFVNAAGFFLQGWPLDREGRLPGEAGNVNTNSSNNLTSLETVNVQQATGNAAATTVVGLSFNLKGSQAVYPGADATADMDNNTLNFGKPAKSIIVPGQLNGLSLTPNANNIALGDKVVISTGSGLSYTYRYGGFTYGRDISTGNNGQSGVATTPTTVAINAGAIDTDLNSQTVHITTAAAHELSSGDVITISGQPSVGGIPIADLNQSFVITVTSATTFDITVATDPAGIVAAVGGNAGSIVTREFAGTILDAITTSQRFFSSTSTSNYTAASLSFSINTDLTGPVSFSYTNSTPNATLRQFNTLSNLADAINSVSGLTARVEGGRLYVGATDANAAVTFTNGSTVGDSGPPVRAGIDWVRELGLQNIAIGDDRFNSLTSLAAMVNASSGLDAKITNELTNASLTVNVEDPLDTITFQDLPVAAALTPFVNPLPFITTTGSNVVTVQHDLPHGFKTGDIVTIDATALPGPTYNGVPIADFSGSFEILSTTPTSYTIAIASLATASGPGAALEGAAGVQVTPPNNQGSLIAELGLADSLFGIGYTAPLTVGPIGPEYDPTDSAKNMAGGGTVPQYSQNVRIYDSLGTGHDLKIGFIKTAANTWAVEVFATDPAEVSATFANGLLAFGTLTFNGDGTLRSVGGSIAAAVNIPWSNGALQSSVNYNWGTAGEPFGTVGATVIGKSDGMSQFDAAYKVNSIDQNGAAVGELISVTITDEGFVVANYNNGESQRLYKIPIATFSNPDQMDAVTGNVYRQSANSGEANLREAGTSGAGKIQASALESSNVDLSQELTDLIVAQRAYQANTKLITTSDNLLEALNNTVR